MVVMYAGRNNLRGADVVLNPNPAVAPVGRHLHPLHPARPAPPVCTNEEDASTRAHGASETAGATASAYRQVRHGDVGG